MTDRRVALYETYLVDNESSDYEKSRALLSEHKDWENVTDIIDRLEKAILLPSARKPGKDVPPPDFFDKYPREFKEEGPFIAIPRDGGNLRLYLADWNMRTFLFTQIVDKKGWWGSWQSNNRIRNTLLAFEDLKNRLNKALDYGLLTVNEGGWGFRRSDEVEIAKRIELSELP